MFRPHPKNDAGPVKFRKTRKILSPVPCTPYPVNFRFRLNFFGSRTSRLHV